MGKQNCISNEVKTDGQSSVLFDEYFHSTCITFVNIFCWIPTNLRGSSYFQAESLRNPTPAMVALMERAEERERERQGMSWREQLQHITVSLRSSQVKIECLLASRRCLPL